MKEAVISLGAGKSQVLVIKKAKSMGFSVIGVDRDRNALGFHLCDEQIFLSTYHAQPIIKQIYTLTHKYDFRGVINRSSGIPVVTCAEICSTLTLPGVNPRSAKIVIDKSELMSFCSKQNISAPINISTGSYLELDLSKMRYPCIVKPALSTVGKSGVTRVGSENELENAIEKAMKSSVTGIIDIEEYVEGYDVSLISVVRNGIVYPITLLDELNSMDETGGFFGVGFAIPSRFTNHIEENLIINLAQDIVTALDLDTTAFLMSCRCDFGQIPRLIEIHLDMGGDLVLDELIPASSDYDVLGTFIQNVTGGQFSIVKPYFKPTAIIYGKGDGLISDRPFIIMQKNNIKELHKMVHNSMEN